MSDDDARRDENAKADDVKYTAPYYDGFGVRSSKAEVASMVGAVKDIFAKVRYEVVDIATTTDPDYLIAEVQGDRPGAWRRSPTSPTSTDTAR